LHREDQRLKRMYSQKEFSLGNDTNSLTQRPVIKSIFKDMKDSQQQNKKMLEANREKVMLRDSQVTKMARNINPKCKTSCHSKFFKEKEQAVIRISFQEFLKANELTKQRKLDEQETHHKLAEGDDPDLRKTVSNLVNAVCDL